MLRIRRDKHQGRSAQPLMRNQQRCLDGGTAGKGAAMVSLAQAEAFLVVAEELHFRRSAERLSLSESA
jgi:hypothetical protein